VTPPAVLRGSDAERPLVGSFEVNERCLEMLVNAARHEQTKSFALVAELRELLKSLTPEARRRAARRAFLLVDMEFANADWWHTVCTRPSQQIRTPSWRGSFPRGPAIQLGHATLMLAWGSLKVDVTTTRLLLGIAPPVADLILGLRFDELDRIARQRYRHVHPRWDDRPAIWRRLLIAAQTGDQQLMGACNLYALQLLAGELLPDAG